MLPVFSDCLLFVNSLGAAAWDKIHSSHRRALVNDIVYCIKCGKYGIKKVEGLSSQCTGMPTNDFGRAQLKKFNDGIHLVRNALSWPDGTSSAIKFEPIRLDTY